MEIIQLTRYVHSAHQSIFKALLGDMQNSCYINTWRNFWGGGDCSSEAAAQQKQPGGISNYPECLIENFLKSSVRAIHDSIIWQLCPEYFDGKQDDDGLYIHIGVYVYVW